MKKNILVVDDSALMRRVICDIINSDETFQAIDTCRDGLDALEKLRAKRYDGVVLDVNMPRMDGLALLEHQAGRGGDPHDAHPDGYASGADAPVHLPALRLGCAAGAGRLRGRVFRSGPAARSLAPDERRPPLRGAGLSLRRKSTNFRAKACEPARYRV